MNPVLSILTAGVAKKCGKQEKGLAKKGFTNFISTNELWDLRQNKLKKNNN